MPTRRRPPTRIFVARHGQTESNRDGVFCGHSETNLTALGREQAAALGRRLACTELHAAYTSDLSRAVETAAIVLEGREIAVAVDPGLRELHYGEWEQQRERLVRMAHPEQFALMRAEDPAWRPPGGETVGEVRARTFRALTRIARRHAGQNVLVVTHGTAINCMLSAVLGIAPGYTFRFDVANCGLSEVHARQRRLVVRMLNDTSHLPAKAPGT
ncbi:MAG: histidine phosphatase family protein [Dehalococcoidia bacterium]|nr:histidine phosphatase family protein [Dehalococcoidia bacterium]